MIGDSNDDWHIGLDQQDGREGLKKKLINKKLVELIKKMKKLSIFIIVIFFSCSNQPKFDYICSHDNPNFPEGLNPSSILLDTEEDADNFCELVKENCGCLRVQE